MPAGAVAARRPAGRAVSVRAHGLLLRGCRGLQPRPPRLEPHGLAPRHLGEDRAGGADVTAGEGRAMTESPKLQMEKDGPIGWIVFNQPEKRNAVSQEMWELMPGYVEDLAADPEIRVVVLRGAGDQAFVAGADISQFKERRRNMADEAEYSRISARGQRALAALGKPLLAMIHGYCVGGGVSIAITCDLRLAADDARFGIPAARLGLGYHYRGMETLMKLIGPAFTKEIFFTARTDFSAADALRMGLVNQVVPKAELEAFTRNYATMIARNAPLTLR